MKTIVILAVLAVIALFWGYVRVKLITTMPGQSFKGELPEASEDVASLEDELRRHVRTLAGDIGERNLYTKSSYQQAASYIAGEFAGYGYDVSHQTFTVENVECQNIEAVLPNTKEHTPIVVIGAHYDSVYGCPGANDNGSGVAALLSLARRFKGRSTDHALRFVAFANEEPPFFQTERMGSWVYAKQLREDGVDVAAMLSLETIGCYDDAPGSQRYPPFVSGLYPDTGNFIGFVGNTASRELVHRCIGVFRESADFPSEGIAAPQALPGVGWSDHWSFWQQSFPAIMVTDTALYRYDHYHTPEDTPDKLDYQRVARVVSGLETVIANLASAPKP